MQVIILAGGLGTRLAEYTKTIPKPMVKILGVPIIERIIKHYYKYGFKDFIVAGGYKQHILKDYFGKNLKYLNIKIVNTGRKTMTGGRIKRLQKMINGKKFTYSALLPEYFKKLLKIKKLKFLNY